MGVYHLEPSSPDDVDDVPPRAASDSSFCIYFFNLSHKIRLLP